MLASFGCGISAVCLLWHSTNPDYGFSSIANASTYFGRINMVGQLPSGYDVSWRRNALLQEQVAGPGSSDISGGWLTGAMAGNLKMTMPTAFTTAMLAWGLASHRNGFEKTPGGVANAEQQVVWGADYLLKMLYSPSAGSIYVITQVGNYTVDQKFWGRPEAITSERPYYAAPIRDGGRNSSTDVGASVTAALLAAYVAVPTAANAASYLARGLEVYGAVAAAARNTGILHNVAASAFRVCGNGTRISSSCDGDASSLYAASTRYDFAFWAAAWAFKATGNATLLADAQEFQASFLLVEAAAGLQVPLVNWASLYPAANLLLAQSTTVTSYGLQVEEFLHSWMCNTKAGVGLLRTTDKARIWSYNDPSLGATANAAFIAIGYASLLRPQGDPKARTYTCWAQQQIRLMLGDLGRSSVVGIGHKPPRYAAVQSASCPSPPATCYSIEAQFSLSPNPQTALGALIFGNYQDSDRVQDSRGDASNMAAVEYNAGFQGALAGLAQYDLNWYQCKVNYGITVVDQTFCARLEREGG